MKMLQAGKNPTVLSCVHKELHFLVPGHPRAQFEQGVPMGSVAGGRLSALSAQVLPAVGQLWPGVCAPSDRIDAG